MFDELYEKLKQTEKMQVIANDYYDDDCNCYMLKYNNHNVYRALVHDDGLVCFQCVEYAVYVNGIECYDDAHDFWYGKPIPVFSEKLSDIVYDTIINCIYSCEHQFGNFTQYEH